MQKTATPASPASPAQAATSVPPAQTAQTAQEIMGLRARQAELTTQRRNLEGRRADLSRELQRTADPNVKERLDLVNKQLIQVETDIGQTGMAIANAPASA